MAISHLRGRLVGTRVYIWVVDTRVFTLRKAKSDIEQSVDAAGARYCECVEGLGWAN